MRSFGTPARALALAALLALPALSAGTRARAEGADAGSATDSRAGVVAAVTCGVSAGLAVRTGMLPLFGIATFFCGYMIVDALITPD
jgi:hypothetical protein